MVWVENVRKTPLELVLTGEAETWTSALGQIVGPRWLHARNVHSDRELIEVVRTGRADAVILDDDSPWDVDILRLLRMVRQMDQQLPVVVVTDHTHRQWLEDALRLAVYSVVVRPLELEELLRQIHGIMLRLSRLLHRKEF